MSVLRINAILYKQVFASLNSGYLEKVSFLLTFPFKDVTNALCCLKFDRSNCASFDPTTRACIYHVDYTDMFATKLVGINELLPLISIMLYAEIIQTLKHCLLPVNAADHRTSKFAFRLGMGIAESQVIPILIRITSFESRISNLKFDTQVKAQSC